jgi:hypothetical protein
LKRTSVVLATIFILAIAALGCTREGGAAAEEGTLRPETPPTAPADADSVPTQTIEIGEERSPNEGGVLTDPDQNAEPTTTTTAASTAATPTTTTPTSTAGTPPPNP